jgi:aminoglycoside phosphotransferase family enzyme/predicted kinase
MTAEFPTLLSELSQPGAFPVPVPSVEVRQTHISAVFLGGECAYKIRKPVRLPFLDFSTLEQRRHDCEEEVRLNRRLAASIYLGVVPITRDARGLHFEGEGTPIEWGVKMRRLPEQATLQHQLLAGSVTVGQVIALGERLARFHRGAQRSPHIARFGRFEAVALNLRQNLELARHQLGQAVSEPVWTSLVARQEELLAECRPLIEARAERGVPCETHGDLHLDHVYFFPESPPPDDVAMIDCIEFNERFRYTDPIADMAFLVMDLKFHGRRDLARAFAEAYFRESGDDEGRSLLALYSGYRAAVRGKVEGMLLEEPEVPQIERDQARQRARAHWLLAQGELLPPGRRAGLLLVGGLPGCGKSTLARHLGEAYGARVIRSDVVRKELAGIAPQDSGREIAGLYSAEMTERVYGEVLRRAEAAIWQGERVVVDAMFSRTAQRQAFLNAADRLAVPTGWLLCEGPADLVRERLARRRGDASDADWQVYLQARARWEPVDPVTARRTERVTTTAPPDELVRRVGPVLAMWELAAETGDIPRG